MSTHTVTLAQWRTRLALYLVWSASGAALAGIDSLTADPTTWWKFGLGLTVSIVGAWRTFLDRSTPEEHQANPAQPKAPTERRKP